MEPRHEAYQYYFYFIQERMNIFWKRFYEQQGLLTNDPIFAQYKFTNVYRAQDRVSQYLIKEVIYNQQENFDELDVLFRILIFKVFNNINTWEYLESRIGQISIRDFKVESVSVLLSERIIDKPIFNGAYLMNGSHARYNLYGSKHERWLRMIEQEILVEQRLVKIIKAKSLNGVYDILKECTFIGSFLAYQYAIDFNYSDVIDFDENSFVKAGIGAIRGIKKCFPGADKYSYEDCIRYTQDNFENLQKQYEFTAFKNLFGRNPTLIDLQNCFCETDKYLRVKMPELAVGNKRIKQRFTTPKEKINYFFPPKWNINRFISH